MRVRRVIRFVHLHVTGRGSLWSRKASEFGIWSTHATRGRSVSRGYLELRKAQICFLNRLRGASLGGMGLLKQLPEPGDDRRRCERADKSTRRPGASERSRYVMQSARLERGSTNCLDGGI